MRFNLRICLIVSTASRPNRLRDFTKIRLPGAFLCCPYNLGLFNTVVRGFASKQLLRFSGEVKRYIRDLAVLAIPPL